MTLSWNEIKDRALRFFAIKTAARMLMQGCCFRIFRWPIFTNSEANRMVFLFELYEKYTAGLFVKPKKIRLRS